MKVRTLIAGCVVAATPLAAQRPSHPQPAAMPRVAQQPARPVEAHASAPTSFKGIAGKLNTTAESLETAYAGARTANPKLTRGQFVAANVLAQNLAAKRPGVTIQALLDGLKAGKSMGQTLQGLGLPAAEAKTAERDANREIREAGRSGG